MSELRLDPVKKIWTVLAPNRGKHHGMFIDGGVAEIEEAECPFCVDSVLSQDMWEIYNITKNGVKELVVTPNREPSLSVEGTLTRNGEGVYDNINGIGANEIIIDSARHNLKASDYTEQELHNLFIAIKARILDLTNDIRFKYIAVIKNIGFLAGEVIRHPHTQVLALPIIPKNITDMLANADRHYIEKERCLFCDILKSEREAKVRIVAENSDFVAIAPYASHDPFEVEIYPKEHKHRLEDSSEIYLRQLADITKELLARYSGVLGDVAINIALRNAPLTDFRAGTSNTLKNVKQCFHWHLAFRPVISHSINIKWATGIAINPVTPEQAAKYLREVNA